MFIARSYSEGNHHVFGRKPVLDEALRRRVVVNFLGNEGSFMGRLASYDDATFVLEQCTTIPAGPNENAQPIAGRQYVDRINCWLQELPA
jgi:hypothetical protein